MNEQSIPSSEFVWLSAAPAALIGWCSVAVYDYYLGPSMFTILLGVITGWLVFVGGVLAVWAVNDYQRKRGK